MKRGNHQDIKSDDNPDSDTEYMFENLHFMSLLECAICQTEIAIYFDALIFWYKITIKSCDIGIFREKIAHFIPIFY